MSGKTNFLLLSAHRSGSTWVVDVLNHLDGASAFSEMFLPPAEKVRDNRPFFQLHEETQNYLDRSVRSYPAYNYTASEERRIRPFAVYRYLDALYALPGAVGFKVMYGQLAAYPEVWPYVMAKKISVIHLIRENPLDILISHEVRKGTRIAHSIAGERDKLPEVQIELDPPATLKRMRSMQRNIMWARKLLAISGVRHMEVTYEGLRQDEATFLDIFTFLGLEPGDSPPQSKLVKLVQKTYPDLIINYEQLKSYLEGTEFAPLLHNQGEGSP